jgi:hypothetical protein
MDTQLYVRKRGQILGPFDQEKLQGLVRQGQLSRMHEVSADKVHWVRASNYSELFAGPPVMLVAPEMQVVSPPPPQGGAELTLVGDDEVVTATPVTPVAQAARPAGIPVAAAGIGATTATSRPAMSAPASPVAPARKWYFEKQGAQQGPVEEAALRQMLLLGQLQPDALVWSDGMAEWATASKIPRLVPEGAAARISHDGQTSSQSKHDLDSLCKMARASRPWAVFLAITAFVYAGLLILAGFLMLVNGAENGIPVAVAVGLFWIVSGAVVVVGGILLANYANRLASLTYNSSFKILESALERLKTFWTFVSIVLVVILAFIGFFVIWALAFGIALAQHL